MYNGEKIKELILQRKIKQIAFIQSVGWSGTSQLNQVVNGDPRVSTLEKVADFFQVSMDTFFKRNVMFESGNHVVGDSNNINSLIYGDIGLQSQVKMLEQFIAEKDKRITALEEMIDLLKNQIKNQDK